MNAHRLQITDLPNGKLTLCTWSPCHPHLSRDDSVVSGSTPEQNDTAHLISPLTVLAQPCAFQLTRWLWEPTKLRHPGETARRSGSSSTIIREGARRDQQGSAQLCLGGWDTFPLPTLIDPSKAMIHIHGMDSLVQRSFRRKKKEKIPHAPDLPAEQCESHHGPRKTWLDQPQKRHKCKLYVRRKTLICLWRATHARMTGNTHCPSEAVPYGTFWMQIMDGFRSRHGWRRADPRSHIYYIAHQKGENHSQA